MTGHLFRQIHYLHSTVLVFFFFFLLVKRPWEIEVSIYLSCVSVAYIKEYPQPMLTLPKMPLDLWINSFSHRNTISTESSRQVPNTNPSGIKNSADSAIPLLHVHLVYSLRLYMAWMKLLSDETNTQQLINAITSRRIEPSPLLAATLCNSQASFLLNMALWVITLFCCRRTNSLNSPGVVSPKHHGRFNDPPSWLVPNLLSLRQ